MRIIALGDTHGRTKWKGIVSNTKFDLVVFIGDYFDTHEEISPEQQKTNFQDLIAYKKANMDKVVLLFGNHDYHYLRTVSEIYSGIQLYHKTDIQEMLHMAIDEDLIQMCYVYENYLFTHAGVTKTWLYNTGYSSGQNLPKFINNLFKYQPFAFRFTSGHYHSPYGDDVCQSPIWVRPYSLLKDMINGFIQVVGHTVQSKLILNPLVVLIDTLGTSGQYLLIDNGQMSVLKHNSNYDG
jgi:hypothetical protein